MENKVNPERRPDHFIFIVNPQSGRRTSRQMQVQIEQILAKDSGLTREFIYTEKAGHAEALAAAAAAQYGSSALVFACGGDGTANEVANGLVGTQTAMGIIPIGTSNDFCTAAYSSIDLSVLLKNLASPQIRPIDLIEFDRRVALNILSLGLDTLIQIKATRLNRHLHLPGRMIYPIAILAGLFGQRLFAMHYQMQVKNASGTVETVEGDSDFILAAFCNGRYYGGGYNPAPEAKLDDGLIDVCLVDSIPLRKILPLIPLYKKGTHLGNPAVHAFSAVSGVLTARSASLPGNADGEVFQRDKISFRILPKALRLAFY